MKPKLRFRMWKANGQIRHYARLDRSSWLIADRNRWPIRNILIGITKDWRNATRNRIARMDV